MDHKPFQRQFSPEIRHSSTIIDPNLGIARIFEAKPEVEARHHGVFRGAGLVVRFINGNHRREHDATWKGSMNCAGWGSLVLFPPRWLVLFALFCCVAAHFRNQG